MKSDSPNLDLLRSFAVLAVAISHLYYYCGLSRFDVFVHNLGVGGVCFFFVHTSLVLLGSMDRAKASRLALTFYVRRAFRIYPLCWACIAFALATGLTNTAHEDIVQMGWRGVLVNVLLLQNIIRVPDIVGPLWSLPWEVQMYLLLPVLFLLIKRYDRPLAIAFAMWFGATGFAIVATAFRTPRAFHVAVIPPMFMGGIVAFALLGKVHPRIPSFTWLLAVPALLLLRCWMLEGDSIMSAHNVAVNAATCLLLGFAIPMFADIRTRWLIRSSHQVAKYSYGIYLFHVPSLVLVFGYFRPLPLVLKIAAFVVLTGTASVIAYHCIEHPLIDIGRRIAMRLDRPVPQLLAAEAAAE